MCVIKLYSKDFLSKSQQKTPGLPGFLYIIHPLDARRYNTPEEFVCHHQKKAVCRFMTANIKGK
jgi:hypothetical protein